MDIKKGDILLHNYEKHVYIVEQGIGRIVYLTQLSAIDGSVIQIRPYFKSTVELFFTKLTI